MLPLEYLDDNRDLARFVAEQWDWDPASEAWFEHFRISSNAIYPMRLSNNMGGHRAILRFAPITEKPFERLEAELDWMTFLRRKGLPVSEHANSMKGTVAQVVETPWGVYVANVFLALEGESLEEVGLTPESAFKIGALLGLLHLKTKAYEREQLHGIDTLKQRFGSALMRCRWIAENCKALPELPLDFYDLASCIENKLMQLEAQTGTQRLGLIHYDFELDNLLYCQETDSLGVVDFDDAMVASLDMDLVRLIDNIEENYGETLSQEQLQQLQHQALSGYRSIWQDTELKEPAVLRAFMDLNWIYRVHYSLKHLGEGEPQWMQQLRGRLKHRAAVRLDRLRLAFVGD